MATYGEEKDGAEAKPDLGVQAVGSVIDKAWDAALSLRKSRGDASHLRLSGSAVFGWLVGSIMIFNAATVSAESSIHQIYQLLGFGQGSLLIVCAGVAQHTKRSGSQRSLD